MKKISLTLLCILSVAVFSAHAQKKKKQDAEAIKSMCGCFDVTFNFAETFSPNKDYEFHDNHRSGGLEYVFPIEVGEDKIVLQHLLIVGDTMIIKHWRQDWLYENTDLYLFDKNNTWKYVSLPKSEVKGQWTQKVYQVDDSPRYEGTATWVHADGRHYWEGTTDAPLPRREFTKRKDYNVIKRRNRQELTAAGWVHEQDNEKVMRENGIDVLIAQEKGWNTYDRTDEARCDVAKKWWETNEAYWADVRSVWDELFDSKATIAIKRKVDDKVLYQQLFGLERELVGSENYNAEVAKGKIRTVIQSYLESDQKLVSLK